MAQESQSNGAAASRRRVLTVLGAGVSLSTSVSVVSAESEEKLPNQREFRERLEKRYGKGPANATVGVTKRFYHRKEDGELSQAEYHEKVTETLEDHPAGHVVAEDVKQAEKEKGIEDNSTEEQDTQSAQTVQPTGVSLSSTNTKDIQNYSTTKNSTAAGANSLDIVFVDAAPGLVDLVNISSTILIYGTSTARIRFYNTFTPDQTGDHNFEITYDRKGKATAGDGVFSLYRKKPSGSLNKKEVESVSAFVDGSTTRDSTFSLQSGKEYTIGFEVQTSASSAGGGGFGDFYKNDRKVNPNGTPSVEWEFIG